MRAIGSRYMIIDNSADEVDFADIYCLNDTAAWLWKKIGDEEFTVDQLATWLYDAYVVEYKVAQADAAKLVKGWAEHGLIAEE